MQANKMEIKNNKHIATMTNRIARDFHPEQIILFGSHARGDAHPHSDVDLLVVFSECADMRKAAIEIRRVLKDMPVPKDIIVSTLGELERKRDWSGSVLRYAQQEEVILYRLIDSQSPLASCHISNILTYRKIII